MKAMQRTVALEQQLVQHPSKRGGGAREQRQQHAHKLHPSPECLPWRLGGTKVGEGSSRGVPTACTPSLCGGGEGVQRAGGAGRAERTGRGAHRRELRHGRPRGEQDDRIPLHGVQVLLEQQAHQQGREDRLGGGEQLKGAGLERLHNEEDERIVQRVDQRGQRKGQHLATREEGVTALLGVDARAIRGEGEQELEGLGAGGGHEDIVVVAPGLVLGGFHGKGLDGHEHGDRGHQYDRGRQTARWAQWHGGRDKSVSKQCRCQ